MLTIKQFYGVILSPRYDVLTVKTNINTGYNTRMLVNLPFYKVFNISLSRLKHQMLHTYIDPPNIKKFSFMV